MARISLKPPRSAAQHWRARGTSTSCCWRDSEDGRSASREVWARAGRGAGGGRGPAWGWGGCARLLSTLGLLALTLHTHIIQKLRQHRPQVCVSSSSTPFRRLYPHGSHPSAVAVCPYSSFCCKPWQQQKRHHAFRQQVAQALARAHSSQATWSPYIMSPTLTMVCLQR